MTMATGHLSHEHREAICEWLTANDVDPHDVPMHGDLHTATKPDGTRVIRYTTLSREHREFPLVADLALPEGVSEVIDWEATAHQREEERDGAYRERAHLVAWLAAMHEAVIAPAPDVDEPGWQIVYVYAGGWQMSWHISPRDAELFKRVEHVAADHPRAQWDRHTTEQKYSRIRNHTRVLAVNGRLRAAKGK